jgi:amino acid adenylation domain-containing protein
MSTKEKENPARRSALSSSKMELLEKRLRGKAKSSATAPAISPQPERETTPLSFTQLRLWLLDQLTPHSPVYNITAVAHLRGSLRVAALHQSLNEVVSRHGSLRTCFREVDGEPAQIVLPTLDVPLPVIDLRELPAAEREAEMQRLAKKEALRPFNLSEVPLVRVTLLWLEEQRHVLLLTMHHIISDGWSMNLLVRELSALYSAALRGESSTPLPPLPIQYTDYALWQSEWLQGERLAKHLSYWQKQLAGAPPLLERLTDRPRPKEQSYQGAHESLVLDAELTAMLKKLGREQGVTLFMLLLAAFKTLLYRLTGQEDLVVGTPIAGRNRSEIEPLIGFFVNTLALRTDMSGNPSFDELLRRVRDVTLKGYEHQELPFEKVLEVLQPEREMSYTPVFQVFFNMLNFPETKAELPDLTIECPMSLDVGSKFDLTLYVDDKDAALRLDLLYSAEIFERTRMVEMLRQYRQLLAQIAAQPAASVNHFSLVTPEAQAVLPDPAEPLSDKWEGAVHEVFARQARRAPQRSALIDGAEVWTYSELQQHSNRLAHYLLSNGIRRGDVVAIYGHRSASLVWALLGVMKAGSAFVIFDPAHPAQRLIEYCEIAQPAGWLEIEAAGAVPPALANYLATSTCRCSLELPRLALASAPNFLPDLPDTEPRVEIEPNDLAYIAFTSGTTGKPKAVMGRHNSLTHFIPWLEQTFGLNESDRFSLLSGLSHDPLHRDVFTPLQLGASVCVPAPELLESPVALAAWMRREAVTVSHLTPALCQLLSAAAEEEEGESAIHSLRYAFIVGDVLTRRDVARLRRLAPSVKCVNFYGTTETQRAVGYFIPDEESGGSGDAHAEAGTGNEILPLGRGIKDVQLLVLNAAGQLAGIGEVGEIYVRSPHLAQGYLGDDELTRAKFIDPSTRNQGARLYRTGDLGRYRADGNVEPLGRADQQVKIRGFRIEPAEIEATLKEHDAVRDCVVLAVEDASRVKHLAACVVCVQSAAPDIIELRQFLKGRLPDFMLPTRFKLLDALPLTQTNKIDRRALAAIILEESGEQITGVEPRDALEETLSILFASVLGREHVRVHDDFFELGGHSLLAVQLVSRMRRSFNIELPLRRLFESPTVAGLAAHVRHELETENDLQPPPPLVVVSRDEDLPLSFTQQRMWILHQLEPLSPAYNIPIAVNLKGTLNVEALEETFGEMVRRHEVLRTTFPTKDGRPIQLIAAAQPLEIAHLDLTALPPAERDVEARRLATEEARRPFELASGPLLRVTLLRLEAQEHVALVTMHHIIADGWSVGVLVREVGALYTSIVSGEPAELPELTIQHADYAQWQREWLRGEALEAQLAYWREILAGLQALELPSDHPRPAVQSFRGAKQTLTLSHELTDALKALSRRESVTLFMTLLAAFQTLLYRYTGQTDIAVGAPVAGRIRAEIESLIGFFVNTLVMRTRLTGNMSFRQLLRHVQEVALGAYAHQDLPFEKLVEELQPERDMSHNPLFQVGFVLQNAPQPPLQLPGITLSNFRVETGTAIFDLNLSLWEGPAGLTGTMEYSTDLFEETTITRLLRHLTRLLENAVGNPDLRLDGLSLLDEEEREQVLRKWNRTHAEFPVGECVHELFERQAAQTPDALAVEFEGRGLTYHELNARANQLARYLQARGVGADVLVGLCLERSLEMALGVLGVLKAGGAYVALDRTYPAERLAYMLSDTKAPMLLTSTQLLPHLPDFHGVVIRLDADWEEIARERADNPPRSVTVDNMVYVTYTSGSTGQPKGIVMTHRPLLNLLEWMRRHTRLPAGARTLQFASLSFDVSFQDIFSTWHSGGTLVMISEATRRDIAGLARAITDLRIHRLFIPAVALQQLAEGFCAGGDFSAPLRKVIAGSEQLIITRAIARTFAELKECALHNEYGPSEAHVVTELALAGTPETWPERPSIGHPISNLQIFILDAEMEPMPTGVPGELYIGGAGLARGYLNRPDLTADRFIPNPFDARGGARLYKTGDLARWLSNGQIEFLGRADHQVKIRGFRVELGEIEIVLGQHPAIREAIVLAREDRAGDKRLVAYVVPEPETQPGVTELRRYLQEKLPEYMLPSDFVVLERTPLTPNGKIDRKALPMPDRARPDLSEAFIAPRTPLEEMLADAWKQILGREKVGVHDSFFELGGHSLLATQLISRLREIFQIEMPMRYLFESPTIAGLAEKMLQEEPQPGYLEETAQLHIRLNSLSDEEVQALLQRE